MSGKNYPEYDIRRVGEMTEDDVAHLLSTVVLAYCYTITGRTAPNDNDLLSDAVAVAKEVKSPVNNYGGWFAEELKQAMWEGAKGKLGDFYGLNIKSYTGFLVAWESSDIRKKWRVLISAEFRRFGPKEIAGRTSSLPPYTDEDVRRAILLKVKEFAEGKSFKDCFPLYEKKHGTLRKIIDSAIKEAAEEHFARYPAALVREADRLGMADEAQYLDDMYRKHGIEIDYIE